jgi:hypothetical protein
MTIPSPRDRIFSTQTLPTPTPTSASVISDEDAAIQLMRLTDPLATPLRSPSIIDEEEHDTPVVAQEEQKHQHNRCTRCIGSKKGCDRKRPCSRCVQQGFEEWECKSDDERESARKKVAALRRSTMMGRTVVRSRKSGGR